MATKYLAKAHIVVDMPGGDEINLQSEIRAAEFSEFTSIREAFESFRDTLAPNESLKKIAMEPVQL